MAPRKADPPSPPPVGIAVLAKAPIPGHAKTRLIPALGADGAATLQGWLLRRTVAVALAAEIGPVTLWCDGDPGHPDFVACGALGAVTLRRQPDADLGARMLAALQVSPTPAGSLVIGTDCPALTVAHLREAAQVLAAGDTTDAVRSAGEAAPVDVVDRVDAVVYPAEDGGYVLIGMRRPVPAVFTGIDWGTAHVMAQTRQWLEASGCTWIEPRTLWDVDRPADLERLLALFPEVRALELGA